MQPDETTPENEAAPPEAKAPSPLRSAGELHKTSWPHAPLHQLSQNSTYFVTAGTYLKQHHFRGRERLRVLHRGLLMVARDLDREACCLYKEALDKHLPPEYSQVVISQAGKKDPEHIKRHYLSDDAEQAVRKAFRKPDEQPKILIVTEKLLTGFDAPILYCMYLDKPMRDHVLLQAIARVNRPYEDSEGQVKPFGFVLDFVGIFEKLEKALAFDSDVVTSVIQNIEVLKQLFATMMQQQAPAYLPFAKGWDDKAK